MTTLRPLKPVVIKPDRTVTPQCAAVVPAIGYHETWRKGRYAQLRPHMDASRCQRESVVEIDGKTYCTLHAGRLALGKWLSGELVERGA